MDAASRGRFLLAFGWLAMAGLFWGGLIGFLAWGGMGAMLGGLAGIVVLGVGGGGVVHLLTDRLGGLGRVLYNPSGSSTPREEEYSYARSLVARGEPEEGIRAYEEHVARSPEKPAPYLAIARILEEELARYEDAARWLRRARRSAELTPGQEILVGRRLIEIYRYKLGEPRRAAPELARLAEGFPETREGEWAARELEELRRETDDRDLRDRPPP